MNRTRLNLRMLEASSINEFYFMDGKLFSKYSIVYETRERTQAPLKFSQPASLASGHLAEETAMRPEFPRLGADLSFRTGIDAWQARWLKIAALGVCVGLLTMPLPTLALVTGLSFAILFHSGFLARVSDLYRRLRPLDAASGHAPSLPMICRPCRLFDPGAALSRGRRGSAIGTRLCQP